jgi:hypothetical protein
MPDSADASALALPPATMFAVFRASMVAPSATVTCE